MGKKAAPSLFGPGAEQLNMQQMQTGDAVASDKRHKRGSDANPVPLATIIVCVPCLLLSLALITHKMALGV